MSEIRTADPTHTPRGAVADILSVCRHARPASAARWLTSSTAWLGFASASTTRGAR